MKKKKIKIYGVAGLVLGSLSIFLIIFLSVIDLTVANLPLDTYYFIFLFVIPPILGILGIIYSIKQKKTFPTRVSVSGLIISYISIFFYVFLVFNSVLHIVPVICC